MCVWQLALQVLPTILILCLGTACCFALKATILKTVEEHAQLTAQLVLLTTIQEDV